MNTMEKKKKQSRIKRLEAQGGERVVLNEMVVEGLKQESWADTRSKGVHQIEIWRKNIPGRGNNQNKFPKLTSVWCVQRAAGSQCVEAQMTMESNEMRPEMKWGQQDVYVFVGLCVDHVTRTLTGSFSFFFI